MRQGRLDHLPGMVRFLTRPVPEGRAETVRHGRNPKLAQQAAQLAVMERPPAPMGEHQRTGFLLQRLRRLENLQGTATQRHPVPAVRLCPPRGDGPHPPVPVDLLPLGPARLGPARCRQHQELKGQLGGRQRRRCPHLPDHRSHLPMGQGLHVLGNVLLGTQHRADPVAGVVHAELHGYGPFQDRPQALAHPPAALYPQVQPERSLSYRLLVRFSLMSLS